MTTYIIRRLILGLIVLILVSMLVFFLMHMLPGDPILLLVCAEDVGKMSEADIEALRQEHGLDKPLLVQYGNWVSGILLHGDLGKSIMGGFSVSENIVKRLPITAHIGSLAWLVSIILGIPMGVICAVRRARWMDTVLTLLANWGVCMPVFWLGIILIYIFALRLDLLPIFGYVSPVDDFWLSTRHVIMPAFCLCVPSMASITRLTRSSMLEVMGQDYIRTAWSKGLKERVIITRHALKNGLIPVITMTGISFGHLIIGGTVLIETVFNIPGMGRFLVTGVMDLDYPVVQGCLMIVATAMVTLNIIIDLSYGWFDPRIRYG
jgi:peptide/nickel transport system permease protein